MQPEAPGSVPRIVLCMRWGRVYGPDYVNVLHAACRANLTGPFRFVCLTDDATGFDRGIEAFPIPDIGLTQAEWKAPGVWPKLAIYVRDLHGLRGRALFIDLDMAVMGPLDAMFAEEAPFIFTDMGQDWRPSEPRVTGTCLFAFDIGAETQILDAFLADKAKAMRDFQNEQDFAGAHARGVAFWPSGWVISFKRHLVHRYSRDLILPPRTPPVSAKVVAFHGDPRPRDLLRRGVWGNFPHLGRGPVPWLRNYWTKNGGRLSF